MSDPIEIDNLVLWDRVGNVIGAAPGSGPLVIGATLPGHSSLLSGYFANGDVVPIAIETDDLTEWEVCNATLDTVAGTLTRIQPPQASSANHLIVEFSQPVKVRVTLSTSALKKLRDTLATIPSHASTHAIAGSDPITPSAIGAAAASHTHTVGDIVSVSSGHLVGRHAGGTGVAQQVSIDGGLELQGANLRRQALTGDVTASAGSNSTTIANNAVTTAKINDLAVTEGKIAASAVTNAKQANMAAGTVKANLGASPAAPSDVTLAALAAALPGGGGGSVIGGSGADGSLTVSGPVSLTVSAEYDVVTMQAGGSINCRGFPLKIRTLNLESADVAALQVDGLPGNQANQQTAGSTASANLVEQRRPREIGGSGTPAVSGSATTGAGTAGSNQGAQGPRYGGVGGFGTWGGTGTGGAGGTRGAMTGGGYACTLPAFGSLAHQTIAETTAHSASASVGYVMGGQGGGSAGAGGGNGTSSGRGGGGAPNGGGVLDLEVGELITGASTPAGVISARGGDGAGSTGTPAVGAGGGGASGGGGGGAIRLRVGKRTGPTVTGGIDARGGDGGTGGDGGGSGGNGAGGGDGGGGGQILYIREDVPSIVRLNNQAVAGDVGSSASGATGGAGGAGAATAVDL